MFINVQMLQYFFHVTFQTYLQKEKNLKNTKVLGSVGLGLGNTLGMCGESDEMAGTQS